MSLALDLTGALAANKVINEHHDVSLQINRYFVPDKGAFYGKGLVVRNLANNQILRPVIDYSLYEPVTDLWKQLGVGLYKIIHVSNPIIAAVSIEYQAVGGQYQYTPQQLASELSGLLAGGDGTYPFGHVVGQPLGGLPPELHLEDGQQIYDAGKVVLALNQMRDVLMNGDRLAMGHIYQYITDVTDDAYTRAINEITAVKNRLDELMSTLDEGVGDIIITDNPTNPAVRKGYGQFQLNPDILLIGANDQTEIGQLVGLKDGSDYYARRTFIWSQVENLGQVSYTLTASATAIDEGESVTFTLTTTGLTAGTRVPYRITGSGGFTTSDIVSGLTGNFIIGSNGIGTVTVSAVNDLKTEGNETFTLAITPVTNVSRTVTIRDTSRSPTITMKYTSNPNGTGSITRCNEGDTIYLYVTGANLPLGHNFNIAYSGSAQGSDFTQPRVVNFALQSDGTLAIPYTLVNDGITDGDRTMIATITSTLITTPVSASITITDTSRTPEYSIWFSSDNFGANVVSSVNEGGSFYLSGKLKNVAPGTQYAVIFAGTSTYGSDYSPVGWQGQQVPAASGGRYVIDFHSGSGSGDKPLLRQSVGLTRPDGEYPLYTVANDFKTEGNETIVAKLVTLGDNSAAPTVLATAQLTINDTSQDASYDAGFYNNADGTGNKLTQCNEGQTIYFVLKTANLQPSERTLFITRENSTQSDDFTTSFPSSVTVPVSNMVSFPITVKNDYLTEGTEELGIIVTRPMAGMPGFYTQLAIATINVMDTSVAPTVQVGWSKNPSYMDGTTSVNEGETAYFIVSATNVPPNTIMNINLMQIAPWAGEDDVVGSIPSQLTLNSTGYGYVSITFKNDMKSEGAEKFTLNAYVDIGGIRYGEKATLNINDTSVPTASFLFSRGLGANEYPISSINENEGFYLIGHYSGYASGEVFDLTFEGADTWYEAPASTCTIDTTWSITYMSFGANQQTDGPRNLTAKVWKNGVQIGSAIITVNDTSVTPPPSPTYAIMIGANLDNPNFVAANESMIGKIQQDGVIIAPDPIDDYNNKVDLFNETSTTVLVRVGNVPAGTHIDFGYSVYTLSDQHIKTVTMEYVNSSYLKRESSSGGSGWIYPLDMGSGRGCVGTHGYAGFVYTYGSDRNAFSSVPGKEQAKIHLLAKMSTGIQGEEWASTAYRLFFMQATVSFLGRYTDQFFDSNPSWTNNSTRPMLKNDAYRHIFIAPPRSRHLGKMVVRFEMLGAGGGGGARDYQGQEGGMIHVHHLKYDEYACFRSGGYKRTDPMWRNPTTPAGHFKLRVSGGNGGGGQMPLYKDTGFELDPLSAIGGIFMGDYYSGSMDDVPLKNGVIYEDDAVVVRGIFNTSTDYFMGQNGWATRTEFAGGAFAPGAFSWQTTEGRGGNNFNHGGGYGGAGASGAFLRYTFEIERKPGGDRLYLPPLVITLNPYWQEDPDWQNSGKQQTIIWGGDNATPAANGVSGGRGIIFIQHVAGNGV